MAFANVNEIAPFPLLSQVQKIRNSMDQLATGVHAYEKRLQRDAKILQELMKDRAIYIRILEIDNKLNDEDTTHCDHQAVD